MTHNFGRWMRMTFGSVAAASLGAGAMAADPLLLKGHSEVVYDAQFLPGGQAAVTASFDRTLKLWDLATLKPTRTMEGHTGIVLSVAVSADGAMVASGGGDNQIRLWDVPKNSPITSINAHDTAATAAALTPDGKTVATADATGVVRLWDAAAGTQKLQAKLPLGIAFLDWRKDGGQLAAGASNGMVWLLNPADGAIQGTFGTHATELTGLSWAPNNQLYTSGADGVVRRWPTQTTPSVVTGDNTDAVLSVAVNPNGSTLVTAGKDKTVRVFNRADGKQVRTLDGHGGEVTAITFSRNSVQVATGGTDKTPRLFDANTGMLVKAFAALPGNITAIEITPDTSRVLVADDAGNVKLFQINDGMELKSFAGHQGAVKAVAFWSNGTQVVTAGADKSVRIWAVDTAAVVRKADLDQPVTALSLANNDTLLAVGTEDGSVRLHNPADFTETGRLLGHKGAITSLEIGPNLQQLASSSADGTARVWDLTSKLPKQFYLGHTGAVTKARILADNNFIVTAGIDKTVRIEPIAAQFVKVADEKRINALAVAPNSAWYATASDDGTVKMWNSADGAPIRAYSGFDGPVLSVTFNANSQQIAAGGKDKTIRTWNPNNGQAHFRFSAAAEVVGLAYCPDGSKLIATLSDKTLPCFDPTPLNPQPAEPPSRDPSQTLSGHADKVSGWGWAPDNRTLWTASADKTLKSWSVAAASSTATLSGHGAPIYGVAFAPSGKTLASCSSDKTIRTWDIEKKQPLKTLATLPVGVNAVAYLPDGNTIVAAIADNSVRLYDANTGSEIRKLTGPEHPVYSIAISNDGNMIAGAGMGIGAKRPVYIWQKDNPTPQAVLTGHKDDIYRVRFNAAGNRVWSIGYAGNVKVWDLGTKQPVLEMTTGVVSYSVALSHDGNRAIISSNDRVARIVEIPANAK